MNFKFLTTSENNTTLGRHIPYENKIEIFLNTIHGAFHQHNEDMLIDKIANVINHEYLHSSIGKIHSKTGNNMDHLYEEFVVLHMNDEKFSMITMMNLGVHQLMQHADRMAINIVRSRISSLLFYYALGAMHGLVIALIIFR